MADDTLYIDKAYLARVIAPGVLGRLGVNGQDQAILSASEVASGYFAQRYKMPLVSVGGDVKLRVAQVAVYLGMSAIGFNPEGDTVLRMNYEDAIKWFEQVAAGKVHPDVTDSSSGAVEQPSLPRARVVSASSRGFSNRGTGRCRGSFEGD